jgi:GPI ethanolamine phosphate transferase 1
MLYLLISFFGTGNIASISSFDPNWVRCYVTTFSPFLMAGLIILKLMLPLFVLVCVLKALEIITKVSTLFPILRDSHKLRSEHLLCNKICFVSNLFGFIGFN